MDKLRPSDFGTYWYGISQELSKVDISPKLEFIPIRSDKHATLYSVAINSLDEYPLYGYLSIPEGDPPFPTIYFVPRNASVLEIIPQGTSNLIRDKFVVFSLACRGMRNSDNPHISMYPGQLTENIETLDKYIYRGIVADTLRGLDFLITRPEVNKNALLVSGNDNALFASALHGAVTHVVSTPAYFFDTIDLAELTASYPLEEINDYLRLHPNSKNKVINVLSYFNLRWHAQAVTAKVLLMVGDENDVYSKSKLDPLIQNITGEVTLKESDNSAYKDGLFIQQWIADEIGDGVPILPDHWK
jgi:cephalosporin-C deacetylase|tara:strand:+ start:679 stop:1584 length:906 start_codon:yes stop_codon:yes gene_type:complete